ncbi:Transposase, IS30 family [Enterococcus faecium]|nr:Transposase, IS30 family [Enterococcus faecium]
MTYTHLTPTELVMIEAYFQSITLCFKSSPSGTTFSTNHL